jgi:hypothetical protein
MLNNYIVTLDVDWAPDWCIRSVADILIRKQVKATWFITHDSPAIRELSCHSGIFELGIHPNFQPNSTQGSFPEEIMCALMEIVPGAVSIRTHGLYQSTSLFTVIQKQFGILNDVSLFLPKTPNIVPHTLHLSESQSILRLPYFWEDDIEMHCPAPDFSLDSQEYHAPGLKIFDFHPIHIALNSSRMSSYDDCKKSVPVLHVLSRERAEEFQGESHGTGTFFGELTDFIVKEGSRNMYTIAELGQSWRNLH